MKKRNSWHKAEIFWNLKKKQRNNWHRRWNILKSKQKRKEKIYDGEEETFWNLNYK